ncbi:MAG: SEL1-like repeat protein [bacterium]
MANTLEISGKIKEELEALIQQTNAGDAVASCRLGDLYRSGLDFPADEDEAIRWYIKATLHGSVMGRNWLDMLLRRSSVFCPAADPVIAEIKGLADKGDPAACCIYGMILRAGWGCTADYPQACDYFRKGASSEHPGCINNLGMMYDSGSGVAQDIQAALECYRKAAEMGDGSALNNLAVMYHEGRGVDRDWMLAVSWYRKAISQGMFKAYDPLQKIYSRAVSRQGDGIITVDWLEEAATNGDAAAQFCLGSLYLDGIKFSKDFVRSFTYFLRAAEQGNVYAQAVLAALYGRGWGTEMDLRQEIKCAKMAAEQWVPEAVGTVARLYDAGLYGTRKQAFHLFKIESELSQGGQPSTRSILIKRGGVFLSQKKYGESVDLFKQMIPKFRCVRCNTTALVHIGVLAEWNNCYGQAITFQRDGDFLQAWGSARESLRIAESKLERDHVDTAASLDLLGELFMAMEVVVPALLLFRRALAIRVRRLGRWHYEVAETVYNIAACPSEFKDWQCDDRSDSRIKLNELALSIRIRVYGESHPLVAFTLIQLADCYFKLGDFKNSVLYANQSVAMYTKELGANHEMTEYAKSQMDYFQQESQAIEELKRLEEEDPFDPNTHNYFERYSQRAPKKDQTALTNSTFKVGAY